MGFCVLLAPCSETELTPRVSVSVMSNNSAASSSLALAQKTVKQLRLEASIRRIKVNNTLHMYLLDNKPLLIGCDISAQ